MTIEMIQTDAKKFGDSGEPCHVAFNEAELVFITDAQVYEGYADSENEKFIGLHGEYPALPWTISYKNITKPVFKYKDKKYTVWHKQAYLGFVVAQEYSCAILSDECLCWTAYELGVNTNGRTRQDIWTDCQDMCQSLIPRVSP